MRIIVVGLGSMGKRRIRLLKKLEEEQSNLNLTIFGVDERSDRRLEVQEKYKMETFQNSNEAIKEGADCAFICTSPLSHGGLIEECLRNGLHVFTEINLVADKYEENIQLAKDKGVVLFLSSTFLYRDEINYIQKEVRNAKSLLSYTYHVGQYLPDWHPWENYTDYFIGDSRTSGCREIMAIDFPWIYKTFGEFASIKVVKGKKTTLKTTYPDSFLLLVEHKNGVQGTIAIDVVSRKAVRNFEVYGEDLYLTWDGSTDGLKKYNIDTKTEENIDLYQTVDRQEGYASFVVENAYSNEIETFFALVAGENVVPYGFEDDKYILSTINEIEGIKGE